MLLDAFKGQTLTMREIYERHSPGLPYVAANYKRALTILEASAQIAASPAAEERPKRKGDVTFADGVLVTFPRTMVPV